MTMQASFRISVFGKNWYVMNRIIYTHKETVYLPKTNVQARYTVIRMTHKKLSIA